MVATVHNAGTVAIVETITAELVRDNAHVYLSMGMGEAYQNHSTGASPITDEQG